jgi:lipoic acid synthetase
MYRQEYSDDIVEADMTQHHVQTEHGAKPIWLKKRFPSGTVHEEVGALISKAKIHTVCQKAQCPNIWECFSRKTATFMIMGDRCTRNCRFCAVAHGPRHTPDPNEPVRIAETVMRLNLDYVVITSVTRDDLSDGGAFFFVRTINEIRKKVPDALIELLIPDLQGNKDALTRIAGARPNVLNHNIETVPRLYPVVRPEAVYRRSLDLLKQVISFDSNVITKSGLMLGLGENTQEVRDTLKDLLDTGCRLLTLGQYLQPTKVHLPVKRFVPPWEFDNWRKLALKMGFVEVACGPFVRSSYQAKKLYQRVRSFANHSN